MLSKKIALLGFALLGTACVAPMKTATSTREHDIVTTENFAKGNSGAVNYIWEEPMVDVVDVPPGLDPEGHYYRPAHQSIVEIRQGRWQYYSERGEK